MLMVLLSCSLCSCSDVNSDFDGKRFSKTRHITVLAESPDDELAGFIHDSVLSECNIDVEFVSSDFFIMEYGVVPDIAYMSYSDLITTYYRMNSVKNLSPYLAEYDNYLTDLKALLGENIYSSTDDPSEVWYLTAKNPEPDYRVTFIRKDWLDALGLEAPSTREEFQDCLIAFRDNAGLLLGDDAANIIPFFMDNKPNVSCKPLFDSFYDPYISDRDFYLHGYCRATQDGYHDGLQTLNEWYHQDLLPDDFQSIRPDTKEYYEPIEKGYVGAFCNKYDYLYKNGSDSHIRALHENRGNDAGYICVNTFENAYGEYTVWQEDYLDSGIKKIFMPSTCSDPLACLVYLNWLSEPDQIEKIGGYAENNASVHVSPNDFLLTYQRSYSDGLSAGDNDCVSAMKTAESLKVIRRGNKCIRYGYLYLMYIDSDTDYYSLYPDSTGIFTCDVICAPGGMFESVFSDEIQRYANSGAFEIFHLRRSEWDKVMINGRMDPE